MKTFSLKSCVAFTSLIVVSSPLARAQVAGPGSALNLKGSPSYIKATNTVWFTGDFTVEARVFVRS
jgi:hypothetical protein